MSPPSASSATPTVPALLTEALAPAVLIVQSVRASTLQPLASNATVRNVNLSPGRSSLRVGLTSMRDASPTSAHRAAVLGRAVAPGSGAGSAFGGVVPTAVGAGATPGGAAVTTLGGASP